MKAFAACVLAASVLAADSEMLFNTRSPIYGRTYKTSSHTKKSVYTPPKLYKAPAPKAPEPEEPAEKPEDSEPEHPSMHTYGGHALHMPAMFNSLHKQSYGHL